LLLVFSASCSTTPEPLPPKASIGIDEVTQAITIEKETDAHGDKLAPSGTPWFVISEGTSPILITAPHGTKPFREGSYRFSDGGGTTALARMLGKLCRATVIYTTYESPSDPNYYDNNAFKEAVAKELATGKYRLLLDIHGSHWFRPYDVDIGTMNGRSLMGQERLVRELISDLKEEGLENISYNYFSAADHLTITKFASARNVPALQLEISSTWLRPAEGDFEAHRFAQLLQALVRYVDLQQGRASALSE
jgi:hypothetical protein